MTSTPLSTRIKGYLGLMTVVTLITSVTFSASAEAPCEELVHPVAKALMTRPHYKAVAATEKSNGDVYLEVEYVEEKTPGYGFVGGEFGRRIHEPGLTRIRPFLASYGIEVQSTRKLTVPTIPTIVRLHEQHVQNRRPHSFFKPVAVMGRIDNHTYLQHLAQGEWPIDGTGSDEFLHDLIVHWPRASFMSKWSAQIYIELAMAVSEAFADDKIQQNPVAKSLMEKVVTETATSVDGSTAFFGDGHDAAEWYTQNLIKMVLDAAEPLLLVNSDWNHPPSWGNRRLVKKTLRKYLLQKPALKKYFNLIGKFDQTIFKEEGISAYHERAKEIEAAF